MGTPPEVMREALSQLRAGQPLPGSFVCAFLRRSVLRSLLAGLPGALDPESPLLSHALTWAVSCFHAPPGALFRDS
eukprot:136391-Alexandrium_andersonii.AAC.1